MFGEVQCLVIKYCDSHCHFDFAQFDSDRKSIWQDCAKLGIQRLVVPGVELKQWNKIADLAKEFNGVYFAVGVHPWWIDANENSLDQSFDELSQWCTSHKCVAIGECGLDASIKTPMILQREVFDRHLALASELEKPIVVHCVKAHHELLSALKHYPKVHGVVHGFSGSLEVAQQYCSKNFSIGVGGTITYARAAKTRNAIQNLPLEALLLETDAPDMPLNGFQGQRNSPTQIVAVANTLAELCDVSIESIAEQCWQNSEKLFGFT